MASPALVREGITSAQLDKTYWEGKDLEEIVQQGEASVVDGTSLLGLVEKGQEWIKNFLTRVREDNN